MTEAGKLLELADRVEKLTGPDREVDIAICALIKDYSQQEYRRYCGIQPKGMGNPTVEDFLNSRISWLSRYTASLDAATQLGDDPWTMESFSDASGPVGYSAGIWSKKTGFWIVRSIKLRQSPTPALALTSARLRARAAQGEG